MVAEVTGHDIKFITNEMPLAQVYQFRTVWFEKHGIEWKVIAPEESPLNRIIQ